MAYYNKSTGEIVQSLPYYVTGVTWQDYGWWPIYDALFTEDLRYWTRLPGAIEFNEDSQSYTQHWIAVPLPLESIKASKAEDFDKFFMEVSVKRDRSVATVAEFQALQMPVEEYAADLNILSQLNMVVEENRTIRASIMATTIPDDAAEEEAVKICIDVINTHPWFPDHNLFGAV